MKASEMIERYVNEVGHRLPRKMRADIEMELRSLLLDAVDERSDGEPTPELAAKVLRDFGHPEAIAAQYRPEESLIGPRLFPTYKVVLTIVLAVVGVLHLLGLGFVLWQNSGANYVDQFLTFVGTFGRTAVLNAGIVTLIFAIIERVAGDEISLPEKEKPWDPFALPPVKDPDRLDRAELIVGIFFSLVFLSWLNAFPNWFGGAAISGEESWLVNLLTPEFLLEIPWLSASLLVDVVLKTAVLLQGRWNRVMRWLDIAASGFGLYVAYRIFSLESISTVSIFTTGIKTVLAFVLLFGSIEILIKLIRLLLGRPFTPRTFIKSKLA